MLGWHTQCNSEEGKMIQKALYAVQSARGPAESSKTFKQDAPQFENTWQNHITFPARGASLTVEWKEWKCGAQRYLASSLVVMEVHGRPGILPGLQRVDKLFGDGLAKAHVVAAAAPEPAVTACEGGSISLAELPVKEVVSLRGCTWRWPRCPFLLSSHPQLSKSPRLQFLVRVYMTPAELMACTNAVSRFAGTTTIIHKHSSRSLYSSFYSRSCSPTVCCCVWTYRCAGCCGWTAAGLSPGSSSGPTQTGTCTPRCRSAPLRPRCWSRSGRPAAAAADRGHVRSTWCTGSIRWWKKATTMHLTSLLNSIR